MTHSWVIVRRLKNADLLISWGWQVAKYVSVSQEGRQMIIRHVFNNIPLPETQRGKVACLWLFSAFVLITLSYQLLPQYIYVIQIVPCRKFKFALKLPTFSFLDMGNHVYQLSVCKKAKFLSIQTMCEGLLGHHNSILKIR